MGKSAVDAKQIFIQARSFDFSATILGDLCINRIRSLEDTPEFPVVCSVEEYEAITPGGIYLPRSTRDTKIVRLENSEEGMPHTPTLIPHIVLSAFSLELYFKCVIVIEGGDARGHSLLKLFNQIAPTSRTRIDKLYQSEMEADPTLERIRTMVSNFEFGLIDCIGKLDDAFVQWRYYYENPSTHKIHPCNIHTRTAIRNFILERKPEWQPLEQLLDDHP